MNIHPDGGEIPACAEAVPAGPRHVIRPFPFHRFQDCPIEQHGFVRSFQPHRPASETLVEQVTAVGSGGANWRGVVEVGKHLPGLETESWQSTWACEVT